VSRFDDISWTTYDEATGLVSNAARTISIDEAGHKWFGTIEGVSKFDGATWTTYTTADGLVDNDVWAIAFEATGRRWFGTLGGLSEYIADGIAGSITPGGGGTVTSGDGSTTLTFAPGAVDADLDVMFLPEMDPAPVPLRGIGHAYELYAVAAGTSGPPVTAIPGTYTVEVQYTDDEVVFVEEGTLALYRWDGSGWVLEPTSHVNPAANTVTATPGRFSHWAVLGERAEGLSSVYLPLVLRGP
jgi:hypothetical protein